MNVTDAFLQAYEQALNSSTSKTMAGIKREALDIAYEAIPEARQYVQAFRIARGEARSAETSEELQGVELMLGMGKLVTAFRKKRTTKVGSRRRVVSEPTNGFDSTPNDMNTVYLQWAQEHDYIPSDVALGHFSEKSRGYYGVCRSNLKKQGWDFESGPNHGWIVKTRPGNRVRQNGSQDFSQDEIALVKRLLEKLA